MGNPVCPAEPPGRISHNDLGHGPEPVGLAGQRNHMDRRHFVIFQGDASCCCYAADMMLSGLTGSLAGNVSRFTASRNRLVLSMIPEEVQKKPCQKILTGLVWSGRSLYYMPSSRQVLI